MTPIANVSIGEFTINSSFGDYGIMILIYYLPNSWNKFIPYDVRITETNTGTVTIENGIVGLYNILSKQELDMVLIH